MSEDVAPSPVVRPAPDPERDARVAKRRAADAARAGRALDELLGVDRRHAGLRMPCEVCPGPCTIDD